MKTNIRLTAILQAAEEGGFVGFIEEIPGINTQGETAEETKSNLLGAIDDYLEAQRILSNQELKGKKVWREPIDLVS